MKKKILICILGIMILCFSGCNSYTAKEPAQKDINTAFREGYYLSHSESDEKCSYFYEFSGGNVTLKVFDDTGIKDVSPEGTYNILKDTLTISTSSGGSLSYDILKDGSLKGKENDLLLEFRGTEEPKHMGSPDPATAQGETSKELDVESDYSAAGLDGKLVDAFIEQLKENLSNDKKEDIVRNISYPINVTINSKRVKIKSKSALLKNYDQVFTPSFKSALVAAESKDLFNNYTGVMFGGNEKNIWINSNSDGDITIISINN